MVKTHAHEVIDVQAEEELRAIMHHQLDKEMGEDFFHKMYSLDTKSLPTVTHVRGRPPNYSLVLRAAWIQKNLYDYKGFSNFRMGASYNFIPELEGILISLERKGRLEAIKAKVGEVMLEARHMLHLKRKG